MMVNAPAMDLLQKIYGAAANDAAARYEALISRYLADFGTCDTLRFFSAPGRTEILGNHTDHNGGKVIAASITMDTICAAAKNDENVVRINSEGHDPIVIPVADAAAWPERRGSKALVAGMIAGAIKEGWAAGGLNMTVSSTVLPSAGVSSSASFEMLFLSVLNALYNDGAYDYAAYARIGQYAENVFWDKASGLMDQMACAYGGAILLNFKGGISCEQIPFDFSSLGYDLFIINTGSGHADLSEAYSAVPNEMRLVASALGVQNLSETTSEAFYEALPDLRKKLNNDRALLRAMHFFAENERVDAAAKAIRSGNTQPVLDFMLASGTSSWELLQNCVLDGVPAEQPIPYVLALTARFLQENACGICRIHGGGFAGVIQAVVKKECSGAFTAYLSRFLSADAIHCMDIRREGAVELV